MSSQSAGFPELQDPLKWLFLKRYNKFFLNMRQTWKTKLILAISLEGVILLWFGKILLLICIVLQFMCNSVFHTRFIPRKLWRFAFKLSFGFMLFSILLLFAFSIILLIFVHSSWCFLDLTKVRFSRSNPLLMYLILETLSWLKLWWNWLVYWIVIFLSQTTFSHSPVLLL